MRQLTAVMSPHPSIAQYRQMLMASQERKTLQQFVQMPPEGFRLSVLFGFGGRVAEKNCPFAIGSRLEKEDRG